MSTKCYNIHIYDGFTPGKGGKLIRSDDHRTLKLYISSGLNTGKPSAGIIVTVNILCEYVTSERLFGSDSDCEILEFYAKTGEKSIEKYAEQKNIQIIIKYEKG